MMEEIVERENLKEALRRVKVSQSRQTDGSDRQALRGQAAAETHPGVLECRGDGKRADQPKRRRNSSRRTYHSPYTKGNFEFERVVTGWRGIHPVIDLRRKR